MRGADRIPEVELVVLVTDMEQTLAPCVDRLRALLHGRRSLADGSYRVTLADNGSTDDTARVAQRLARSFGDLGFVRLPASLDRRDLRARWADSPARTVAFLDLTSDTDLDALLAPVLLHEACLERKRVPERLATGGLVNRRAALATIGGLGLTALISACSSGGSPRATKLAPSSSTEPVRSSSSSPAASRPLVLAPELMEGPYYLDVNKIRSDITEGRRGVPLALNLIVADVATGAPIRGSAVDIWHCDAEGLYSGFVDASAAANKTTSSSADDGTFLRGTQYSGNDGKVTFATIYPGWYGGRAVHIHVKVHAGGSVIHVGQLFFDDALSDSVFSSVAPYSARAERDVRNAADSIYAAGGGLSTLGLRKSGDGYATTMTIGVKPT